MQNNSTSLVFAAQNTLYRVKTLCTALEKCWLLKGTSKIKAEIFWSKIIVALSKILGLLFLKKKMKSIRLCIFAVADESSRRGMLCRLALQTAQKFKQNLLCFFRLLENLGYVL